MDLLMIALVLVMILSGVQSYNACPICYCYDDANVMHISCVDVDLQYIPEGFSTNFTGMGIIASQIEVLLSGNLSIYSEFKSFTLIRSPLYDIEVGAFDGLAQLQALVLTKNNLTLIKPGTLAGLPNLTYLDLNTNSLTGIPPLNNLTSLIYLNLKMNDITSLAANAFGSNLNLTTIDLSYNLISTVEQGAFNNLRNLEYLIMEVNDITDLGQGLFNGLDSLKHLLISHNMVTDLTDSTFIGTGSNMELLELYSNKIVNITDNSFATLSNLSVLNLNSNYLTAVPSVAIRKIQTLTEIHLSRNLMTEIQDYSFSDLPLLDTINISHMDSLTNFDINAFNGTTTLTQLSIYDNKNLTEFTLAHLPDVEHVALTCLKIYNNGFTTLQEELFSNKTSLEIVDLFGNPFHCDCALNWMPRVMQENIRWAQHWNQSHPIICESPPHLQGFDIRVMKELDLTCQAPQIELNSPQTVVAYLHGNASLKVLAHNGLPHTWWKSPSGEIYNPMPQPESGFPGSQLPVIAFEEYLKINTETVVISTLMFSNAVQQDAGNYTVYAGNHIDNAAMVIYLEVLPYELTVAPSTTPITSAAVPPSVETINYVLTISILLWMRLL